MRQDLLDSSSDQARRGIGLVRALAAALIVLGIASIAFLVQPDARRPSMGDFGAASVMSLPATGASESSAPTAAAGVETPAEPSAAPRFERSDEPAVEDTTNAHGG